MTLPLLPRLLLALFALAAVVPTEARSTYTGRAPVKSQSDADRVGAMGNALRNVILEQVGGDRSQLEKPEAAQLVSRAERYVLQYSYRPNTSGDGAPFTLVAQFDAEAIDKALQTAGLGTAGGAATGTTGDPLTASEATVWIAGLRDANDFLAVLGYLRRQSFVRDVRPQAAQGDGLQLRLALAGDLPRFLDAITQEGRLAVDTAATPTSERQATLRLAR